MVEERRYREDEVGEIFALATHADETSAPALVDHDGLTLGELQEVGREVGLAPEQVAAAAAALDTRRQSVPRRTTLGAPKSAGHVVELPRAPTDREWEVLVAELRDTFRARGRVASHGGSREWTNGNLHAFVEPTPSGHRLRLGTHKTGATAVTIVGVVPLMFGLTILAIAGIAGGGSLRASVATLFPMLLTLAGGGVLVRNQLRLRRWASERESQMEHIAARARTLLQAPPEGDPAT